MSKEKSNRDLEQDQTLPEVGVDGPIIQKVFGPAAEEFGQTIRPLGGDAGRFVIATARSAKILLTNVSKNVFGAEKIEEWLSKTVDKKLSNVPYERRIEPDLSVAGPVVEALRFTGHNPEISELFANLLANSMDEATASKSHPAFVEIIKQITPDEARIVKYLALYADQPFIEVRMMLQNENSYQILIPYYSDIGYNAACRFPSKIASYVENLCRLQLCQIPHEASLTGFEYNNLIKKFDDKTIFNYISNNKGRLTFINGVLAVTHFGRQFMEACTIAKS